MPEATFRHFGVPATGLTPALVCTMDGRARGGGQIVVMDVSEVELRTEVGAERVPQLIELFAGTWSARDRSREDVTRMLAASDLAFGLVHRVSDRLVGFARVLTDDVYVALVLDVVVAAEVRGGGLGAMLLDAVVGHPRVAGVHSVELVCQPEMLAFYRRWGFTERVGRSTLMRRATTPPPRRPPAP
jgi:GNAT superfamily N-acetyltransferase